LLALATAIASPAWAENLFGNEPSEGEVAVIEERGATAERGLRHLRKLELLLHIEQMQRGDCGEALAIEGKAKSGDADAQWTLGQLQQAGLCFPKDPASGLRWLQEAAKQGNADANHLVAVAHLRGDGTKKDPATAYPFMRKAAEGGSPEGMIGLALMLIDGKGAPHNPTEAASWLEKAANEGEIEANARLGWLHLSGDLGQPNPAQALEWARPASESGLPFAQLISGLAATMLGKKVEAHKWLNLASASGVEQVMNFASEERAKLEPTMTPGQLAEARKQASHWKPRTAADDLKQGDPPRTKLPAYDAAKALKFSPETARAELARIGVGIEKDAYFDAARTDNLGIFVLFHRAGADLDERLWPMGWTPLYVATDYGSEKVFAYLLRNKASVDVPAAETGMTPLVRAIGHKRPKMVAALLDAGASAKKLEGYSTETTGNVLAGGSPLLYAIMFKDSDPILVRRLLDAGGSAKEVYSQGKTTLMHAAEGNPQVFRLLLERGADPNAVDVFGESVLHALVAQNKVVIPNLKAALAAGAQTRNWRSEQLTPLLRAVWSGNVEATAALLAAGAQADLPMRLSKNHLPMNWGDRERLLAMNGGTPLMLAASLGHAAVANVLIEAGANPNTEIEVSGMRLSASAIANESGNAVLMNAIAGR